jgi:hypothetical protein
LSSDPAPPKDHTSARPSTQARLIVAVAIAVVAALLVLAHSRRHPTLLALDFTWHWRAARAILAGQNPYLVIKDTGPYPFSSGYYYPLPAAIVALPVAWMSAAMAHVTSVAVWTFLLAFALTHDGWYRLPLFLSAGFFWSVVEGQVAPLLMIGCLLPAFQMLAFTKPNVGLAIFAYRPSWWTIVGGIVGSVVALIVIPTWLMDWRDAIRSDPGVHLIPLFAPGGFLLIAALLRWRRADARMLLVLSCVPQSLAFYDALPLLLLPRTFRQALVLAMCTQLANLFATHAMTSNLDPPALFRAIAPFAIWGCYIPPLVLLLTRRNEGTVPRVVERFASKLPAWLRGSESAAVEGMPNTAQPAGR